MSDKPNTPEAVLLGVTPCGDCPDPGPCDDTCPRGID